MATCFQAAFGSVTGSGPVFSAARAPADDSHSGHHSPSGGGGFATYRAAPAVASGGEHAARRATDGARRSLGGRGACAARATRVGGHLRAAASVARTLLGRSRAARQRSEPGD